MTDFAVVIGISRYPELSAEGVAADLDGPNNDALAVRDWLVDPDGGGLQSAHVKLIRSADFDPIDPDDPQPARGKIDRALNWVEEQTRKVPGDRLYLYFSGHGFSPRLEEGALFTAEASQTSPEYVFAHSWVRWFRQAQRFRETVLWMDSCMNYQQSIPVNEVILRHKIGTGVPGPAFMALAAQTKSALEHKMPDGQVHGVFTWTLLHGLRGGAADERGRVTGESLRKFLFTVMPEFLPDTARNSTAVDLYPFVRADDGIVFHRLRTQPKYPVRLVLPPAAVGAALRIWTGRPLTQVVSEVLATAEWNGELRRGLYMAEVASAGLRHGFQVSGARAVTEEVTRTGPPVTVPDGSEMLSLDVVAGNPAAAISVMDYRFDRIFSGTGELHEQEMPGVYKVRVEFGRDITMISDEVLLLDRDGLPGPVSAPPLPSPAPIRGSAKTHEFHVAAFEKAANRRGPFTQPAAGLSGISVLARYWTEPGGAPATAVGAPTPPHPMHGLELVDAAGRPVVDLSRHCEVDCPMGVDAVAVWEGQVRPATYFLRQVLRDGRQYEGCVIASPDWITQVAVQRVAQVSGEANQPDPISDVAVFMRRAGLSRAPDQDAVIEAARLALAQGRNLFAEGRGARLAELLIAKFTDPIAGIIGGHLLLRAMDGAGPDPVAAMQFDSLVTNLRSLVGPDHPDVEALSLRCTDAALRTAGPFTAPPTFRHSWQLVTEASYQRVELVPLKLWQRVHASVALGAFFVWAADEQTRATHVEQLSRWISHYAEGSDTGAMQEEQSANRRAKRSRSMGVAPATYTGVAASTATEAEAAATAERAWKTMPLPEAARDAAYRLQVPAMAAGALWAQRQVPKRRARRQD